MTYRPSLPAPPVTTIFIAVLHSFSNKFEKIAQSFDSLGDKTGRRAGHAAWKFILLRRIPRSLLQDEGEENPP